MARMDWMDTLRGGAVVGVVIMHAELSAVSATGHDLPLVHAFNHLLGDYRMPVLVLLSGVLVPRSVAKGFRSHLRGKVHHILWPYAVWVTFDLVHVFVDCLVLGKGLPWHLAAQVFYDPHTYLWFLAYLFCFHLLAGVLSLAGPLAPALAMPAVFWAHTQVDHSSAEKFLWLFGWFLVGDVLARLLTGRVPAPVVRVSRHLRVPALAAVGRSSLVYYASHMLVIVYAVPLLHAAGVTHPGVLWASAVAVALIVGRALAGVQHRPGWRWLFSWPRRQPAPARAVERQVALVP
ncbi:acyltransferase family protein [Nocardioides cavernaquae]|nr:acyltransferase family protein [Nocardioides cavernaquae]